METRLSRRQFLTNTAELIGAVLASKAEAVPVGIDFLNRYFKQGGEKAARALDEALSARLPLLPRLAVPQHIGGGDRERHSENTIHIPQESEHLCRGTGIITAADGSSQSYCKIISGKGIVTAVGFDGKAYTYHPDSRTFELDAVQHHPSYAEILSPSAQSTDPYLRKIMGQYIDINKGTDFLNSIEYSFAPTILPTTQTPLHSFIPPHASFVDAEGFKKYNPEQRTTYLMTDDGYLIDQAHAFGIAGNYFNILKQLKEGKDRVNAWGFHPGFGMAYDVHTKPQTSDEIIQLTNGIALNHAMLSEYMQGFDTALLPNSVSNCVGAGLNFEDVYTNNYAVHTASAVLAENPGLVNTTQDEFVHAVIDRMMAQVRSASPSSQIDKQFPVGTYPNIYVNTGSEQKPPSFDVRKIDQATTEEFSLVKIEPFQSAYHKWVTTA